MKLCGRCKAIKFHSPHPANGNGYCAAHQRLYLVGMRRRSMDYRELNRALSEARDPDVVEQKAIELGKLKVEYYGWVNGRFVKHERPKTVKAMTSWNYVTYEEEMGELNPRKKFT